MPKYPDITPFNSLLRYFLRGRKVIPTNRYADVMSSPSQPPPNIPGGPYHKTSQIYYFTRDARREVQPPIEVPIAKKISGSEEKATKPKYITPGEQCEWH